MKVSVIIPCYNQAQFLDEAIQSALNQGIDDLEVIVVNDGSTDGTAQVAGMYPGVTYLEQENRGLAVARNRGFVISHGEYIVFLDSDDYLGPKALSSGLGSLRAMPAAAFTFGVMQTISMDGKPIALRAPRQTSKPYMDLLANNYIPTPGMVLFRRAALERYGPFDQTVAASADYDLYLKISRSETVATHPEIAVFRRFHPGAMTGNPGLMLASTLKVLNRHRTSAKADPELRALFDQGQRYWRSWYGDQVLTVVRAYLHRGRYWDALKSLAPLLRHCPALAVRLINESSQSNRLIFRLDEGIGRISSAGENSQPAGQADSRAGGKRIMAVTPAGARPGKKTAYTWHGNLIVTVSCVNANRCAMFFLEGQPIETVWINSTSVLAYLPLDRLRPDGDHEIYFVS